LEKHFCDDDIYCRNSSERVLRISKDVLSTETSREGDELLEQKRKRNRASTRRGEGRTSRCKNKRVDREPANGETHSKRAASQKKKLE